MTAVLYVRLYAGFMEIRSNLGRKKLHRTNQGSKFLEEVVAIETIQDPQFNLEEKDDPNILKEEVLQL